MTLKVPLILIFLPSYLASAQSAFINTGASNEALAGVTAVARNEWSLWRNPAGLTWVDATSVSFGVRQTPVIDVLTKSALVAVNTRAGCFAGGMLAFGDELYNEQALSLAYAHHIGLTSVGIRADAFQLRVDSQVKRTFGVTIGGITSLGKRVLIGAVARNINLPQWTKGQSLPVVLNAGVLFLPSDNFMLIAEVEKNTDFDPTIKSAFEYSMKKKFFIRTGFNLFPNAAFGGFGFRLWRIGFDYALRWGYLAGYTHQLSVSVTSKKNGG